MTRGQLISMPIPRPDSGLF